MNRFRQEVENRWRKWLNRRNNIRSMHWEEVLRALLRVTRLLPLARHAFQTSSRSETVMRGTVCGNVRTYGSVGACIGVFRLDTPMRRIDGPPRRPAKTRDH